MPQFQFTRSPQWIIPLTSCARYGVKVMIVQIGPENPSVDQYTIECDKWGNGQTTLVKTQAGRISA